MHLCSGNRFEFEADGTVEHHLFSSIVALAAEVDFIKHEFDDSRRELVCERAGLGNLVVLPSTGERPLWELTLRAAFCVYIYCRLAWGVVRLVWRWARARLQPVPAPAAAAPAAPPEPPPPPPPAPPAPPPSPSQPAAAARPAAAASAQAAAPAAAEIVVDPVVGASPAAELPPQMPAYLVEMIRPWAASGSEAGAAAAAAPPAAPAPGEPVQPRDLQAAPGASTSRGQGSAVRASLPVRASLAPRPRLSQTIHRIGGFPSAATPRTHSLPVLSNV